MKVLWTDRAVADLRHVRAYLGRRNRTAARRVATRLRGIVKLLETQSGMGRAGRVPGTRELVVTGTPYLVAYRVQSEVIEILRVLHGAQEWPDKFHEGVRLPCGLRLAGVAAHLAGSRRRRGSG